MSGPEDTGAITPGDPTASAVKRSSRARRAALGGCGLGLLGFLVCCNLLIFLEIAVASPVALALSVVAAVIPAGFWASVIVMLDRYEREPAWVLAGAFLWGAMVATVFSYAVNTLFSLSVESAYGVEMADLLGAAVSAPIVEESAKGAVLLLLFLFLRREFDNVLDGIVYGSLVGIGFAMTENVLYFGRAYLDGALAGLSLTIYLRVILGGLGHAAYTATIGAGFGFARASASRFVKIAAPIAGLLLAMLQHFAWNFFVGFVIPDRLLGADPTGEAVLIYLFLTLPLISLLFTGPAVATLLVLVAIVWRREARIIVEQLGDEVAAGVLTPAEYGRLSSSRRRIRAELRTLRRGGVRPWWRQMQLHQAATELAFRKWHLSRGEQPKREQKETSEDQYRRRIRELRAAIDPSLPERHA